MNLKLYVNSEKERERDRERERERINKLRDGKMSCLQMSHEKPLVISLDAVEW